MGDGDGEEIASQGNEGDDFRDRMHRCAAPRPRSAGRSGDFIMSEQLGIGAISFRREAARQSLRKSRSQSDIVAEPIPLSVQMIEEVQVFTIIVSVWYFPWASFHHVLTLLLTVICTLTFPARLYASNSPNHPPFTEEIKQKPSDRQRIIPLLQTSEHPQPYEFPLKVRRVALFECDERPGGFFGVYDGEHITDCFENLGVDEVEWGKRDGLICWVAG